MPDPIVPPEEKVPETPAEPTIGEEVRNKSFRELALEEQKERREANQVVPETVPDKPTPTAEELEAQKQAEEKAAIEKQAADAERAKAEQAELARVAAEQALAKQREEEKKRVEEIERKEKEAKQNAPKSPPWRDDPNRPKDEKGNPLPTSYDEIYEAAKEAAKAETLAELEARDRAKAEAEATQRAEAERQEQARLKYEEEQNARLNEEIMNDMNDLYATEKLPRIKDESNPNDPGVLARKALFETGVRINQDRMTKGLLPIRSIKLIYYEHYKAPAQPAGHDAPVMGNTPPPSTTTPEDEYDWDRDHGKSMRQILAEEKARLRKS